MRCLPELLAQLASNFCWLRSAEEAEKIVEPLLNFEVAVK